MTITLQNVRVERFDVDGHFTIARGAKTFVDVVTCAVSDDVHIGTGEGTPIYYEGETAELCAEAIRARMAGDTPVSRDNLLTSMKAGAGRNALDCALWDLEVKRTGQPLWQLAGLPEPKPLVTAITISLDAPDAMEGAARKAAANGYRLLKMKLSGEGDLERVRAVRMGAPDARFIVDANESWDAIDIGEAAGALAALGVEMIEQPVSAGKEHLLRGVNSPVPFCADESIQTLEDLDRIDGAFQAINIKLDKTGGLTAALLLAEQAQARGLDIMVGCMLSTSLGIRPAFALAQKARWVDLDGPALLKQDRPGGFIFKTGMILP